LNTIAQPVLNEALTWPASLQLLLAKRGNATRLRQCRHQGPLYVQKAFYPEGEELAHLYLLHPPGGVVSGDQLRIEVTLEEQAQALITTPGAARIYRARDTLPLQQQSIELVAGEACSLEWFPLETIVYNGACVELDTTIRLAADSHFIGWELTCFGLPASGELFERGSFRQRYRVWQEGLPAFVEQLEITPDKLELMLQGSAGLRGAPVTGIFIAGPLQQPLTESALQGLRDASTMPGADLSQVGQYIIGRYLGDSAEQGRRAFTQWWQYLRPLLLGRPACAPRIWLT
jgi:urease accessory protein